MISCTASSLPIIGLGAVERALKARRQRPMFMVDLAVPRDIESEIGELDDVFLYTVDDLAQVVSEQSLEKAINTIPTERFNDWTERLLDERARLRLKRGTDEQNIPRENLINRVANTFARVGAKR